MYDVVIVGAGPAGCAAALSLPPGTRGLLVDRSAPGAERCCGGLLAPDAQEALTTLGLALPRAVRLQPEPRMVRVHDVDSGRSQSYRRDYLNVDRRLFDSWLLALAAERVEVRQQTRFAGFDGPNVVLRSPAGTETVEAGIVIGADGAGSAVRKACFPLRPQPPQLIALQARLTAPDEATGAAAAAPPTHTVLFSSALTGFYAWAIPKGGDVVVGCAFHESRGARERFEEVLDWYRRELALEGVPHCRSGRYLSQPMRRAHLFAGEGPVLLAGEAAGLVSPSSGEGISFALLSGAAAGRAVGSQGTPHKAYAAAFDPLARRIVAKMAKARIIYSPSLRGWALRLPWCP